jgi:hypothetical protein
MTSPPEPRKVAIFIGASQGSEPGSHGPIDTLINNPGIFSSANRFLEYTDFTQRVVRHMAEQARGHVVSITTSLVDHARSPRHLPSRR